jgi:hypothetical protein
MLRFLVGGWKRETKAAYIPVRYILGFEYSLLNLFKAMRQTWEEIGLDLAERDFICVGQLDDREITTSLGKRLLMILSPFGLSVCLSAVYVILRLSSWHQYFSR